MIASRRTLQCLLVSAATVSIAPVVARAQTPPESSPRAENAPPPESAARPENTPPPQPALPPPPPMTRTAPQQAALPTEEATPPSARMRFDTIFRGVPRYALTTSADAASADDRYWRAVTMAPLQQRATLDASGLMNGHLEAHLSAWGAIDLASFGGDVRVAGDVAVAWMKYRRGPWGLWGGRRFMPWGAPGGVHVDGLGGEMNFGGGVTFEAVVGRPVTPQYAPTLLETQSQCGGTCGLWLGPRPGFEGVTAAGGARLAWSSPGLASAAVSFLEHWAQGIPARRVVEGSFIATPTRWLDARGTLAWDMLGLGVMQADLDLAAWLGRRVEFDVGYGHLNPQLLIPRYSILSVFVTREFDEGRARVAWRIVPMLQVGIEGAMQHYDVPGRDASQYGAQWGSRAEVWVRVNSTDRRAQLLAMASHRDDGTRRMTLIRIAGQFPIIRDFLAALEAAVALDNDDFTASRTSWYGRASVDGPLTAALRLGASIDGVRSPIAASELRGMVHLTARLDLRTGAQR